MVNALSNLSFHALFWSLDHLQQMSSDCEGLVYNTGINSGSKLMGKKELFHGIGPCMLEVVKTRNE